MTAREIIDANRYMVLATSGTGGAPWASPVWFAHRDHREFFWVSDPDSRHSRNLTERSDVAIVIFDSSVAPADAAAVYLTAKAEQAGDGIELFSAQSVAQGLPAWTLADVTPPARFRLYRATAAEQWILGPGSVRLPARTET